MSDADKKGKLRPLRPDSQPISASSLPLPSGASTSAKQTTSDEQVILLRRIVKLLESNAVVDYANRQRVVLDSLPGAAVGTTLPISGSVTATVSSTTVTGVSGLNYGLDERQKYIDAARLTYADGIRRNLSFS